uniref:Uncharacterized protein n=1 Tax=Anguilla anguilla TaxID=7936 RepID=A0A0E9U4I0_ANGAN
MALDTDLTEVATFEAPTRDMQVN